MDDDSCETCRFWEFNRDDMGECRRRSPQAALTVPMDDAPGVKAAYWPTTLSDEWCGEFELRKPLPVVTVELPPAPAAAPEKVPISPTPLDKGDTADQWRTRWAAWIMARGSAVREVVDRMVWPKGDPLNVGQIRISIDRRLRSIGGSWEPPMPQWRPGYRITYAEWHRLYMPPSDFGPHLAAIRGADVLKLLREEWAERRRGSKIQAYVASVIVANGGSVPGT